MSLKTVANRIVRNVIIRTGLEVVALSNAGAFLPSAAGRGVIFTLHHVRPSRGEPYQPNALLSVTPQFLDAAIGVCLQAGLVPVAVEELPRLLADPSDDRRFVSFTLDDGYRNNAEHAAPVFRKNGVPYTIFICKGFVERTRSMWWETAEQLTRDEAALEFDFGAGLETVTMRSMDQKQAAFDRISDFVQTVEEDAAVALLDAAASANGIDPLAIVDRLTMTEDELRDLARDPLVRFGAHTLTHANLKRVDAARLKTEITGSMQAVTSYIGRKPTSLAYPYGYATAVGEREFQAAVDAGLEIAVTTQPGTLRVSNLKRPTAFNRVSLNGLYQKERYVRALLSGIPFKLM
ncbi:polysaccharide deacetylase family protein [Mesorhizobium sp. Root157]|uniref:polysaccharide deacetylase family protein n=1 Tax=Mesorhizobium sp. Root157 TaxID=1736477 RepID=UPI001FCDDA25|nr:polysaccharide deacetylase family protein [Mesorhizobium sp. Root157]